MPEFAAAVEKQKKGELSAAPVKSQFGWHIIQVDDSRNIEFPKFEEVKPQIEEMLRQKQLTEYQESLMKNAKVN